MHLDEEEIQRHLHGELPPPAELRGRVHLAECADCRRRLADAEREEREVETLLHALDDPLPRIEAEALAARAVATTPRSRFGELTWLRRAAAILLAIGIAGVAYALPGSPVQKWVHAFVEKLGGRPEPHRNGLHSVRPLSGAGISVSPDQMLVIVFRSGRQGGRVAVSLTDNREVEVQAPPGAATYASAAGRLTIDIGDAPAVFEIRIPRSAPWVEVWADSDRLLLKEGSRVTPDGARGAAGEYLLQLPARPPGTSGPTMRIPQKSPGP